MAHSQVNIATPPHRLNLARIALTAFGALLAMGILGWDEVLLAAPIIFLVETLGFGLGLAVFIGIWALLGYSMLLFVDLAWPKLQPLWESLMQWTERQWEKYAVLLTITVAGAVVVGAVVGFRYYPLHTFVAIAAVFFVGVMEVIRQLADRSIRKINPRGNRWARWAGAVTAVVILGPVFAWTLLRWLGFTRGTVYVLTVPAAVIFGLIWVPYYSQAVWGLGLSRVF